ncbi:MAG TPA: N-acetyl-gamma-glutamyl-phosphate reductase [Solirubrobacteraceae bacterium]|nr:N-acetyl-gamma-glutamyl-phosphate reductase [Solirubrobacteraceae bacterium]
MAEDIQVAVLGASGYAGALAAALVQRHPRLRLAAVSSRSDAGRRLGDLYPRHRVGLELIAPEAAAELDVDAVIIAYPHMAAATAVAHFLAQGSRVVDLSADFRLRDPNVYAAWYGEHPAPELIASAVYGLPELHREAIRGARLVANPGCYPTAAILALAPLARAGLISDLVVDAKSGVSGAGRAATEATHFVSVDENVSAYKVPRHRHTPEIEQELTALGNPVTMTFTPHLLPLDQGELVSCYVGLADRSLELESLRRLYSDAYAEEPWVELADRPPGVRDVRETNFCRIHVNHDPRTGRAIVFGVIDNLWKGTASQAIQNLNLMFGLDENLGLLA